MQAPKRTSTPSSFAPEGIANAFLGFALYVILDCLWINWFMAPIYSRGLGALMIRTTDLDWRIAVMTWALIVLGYRLFAFPRAMASGNAERSLVWGALYGLVVYGVFTLTNLAILRCWSPKIALWDIASGVGLCGILSLFMCRSRLR